MSARKESLVSLLGAVGSQSMILSRRVTWAMMPFGKGKLGWAELEVGGYWVCAQRCPLPCHVYRLLQLRLLLLLPSVSLPAISRSKNAGKIARCSKVLDSVVCSLLREVTEAGEQ